MRKRKEGDSDGPFRSAAMSATRGSKKKVDLGYDAGDSMKKATGT